MVAPRSLDNLAAIATFVIGLYFPIRKIIFISYGDNDEDYYMLWIEESQLPIISYLILLQGCTIIVGITVRRVLKQRISAVLTTIEGVKIQPSTIKDEEMPRSWNDFEDELFKSWIVARVSQPDYVIARSILSPAAGLVVTFSVVVSMIDQGLPITWDFQIYPLFLTLWVFVLEEWAVICCRWYSSLLIRKRYFCFEDFWTRALSEKIDMYDLQNCRPTSNFSLDMSLTRIVTLLRLHKLLHLLQLLQIFVILVSKFVWLISEIVLGKLLRQCHKHAWYRRERIQPASSRYCYKSYATLLERICMSGEDPSNLWNANKRAINKITLLLKEGRDDGSITNSLFTPFSLDWVDQGFQLVDKLQKSALPQVVEYFPNSEKLCWKMTVVSLTLFMIKLHKQKKSDRVSNAFKACNQAWDLLSFFDKHSSPFQADSFDRGIDEISMVADKEFSRLRQLYANLPIISKTSAQEITIEMAKSLSMGSEALLKIKCVLGDLQRRANKDIHTKDWMKIAPTYNLYKICKVMETELEIDKMEDSEAHSKVDIAEDLIAWTESSLRNVIVSCMWMVPDMLAKHCRICAQGFDEDKIWEAIYLAGKVRGMMEPCGLQLKRNLNEWTLQFNPVSKE